MIHGPVLTATRWERTILAGQDNTLPMYQAASCIFKSRLYNCLCPQLRSIDRLLEKLRASVDQADKPFGSSMHTRNLRDRIRDLVQERQEICFEAR